MKIVLKSFLICALLVTGTMDLSAQNLVDEFTKNTTYSLLLKQPGNPSQVYTLRSANNGHLQADQKIPLKINQEVKATSSGSAEIIINIEAISDAYFSLQGRFNTPGLNYDTSYMYLPGFWYRKNLRSPDKAPSARLSKNWIVREDF